MLSLPDLVRSKKTQRDEDWPIIRELVESDYARVDNPSAETVKFWLLESRTPDITVALAKRYVQQTGSLVKARSLLAAALIGDTPGLEAGHEKEMEQERDVDRIYWMPLCKELYDLVILNFEFLTKWANLKSLIVVLKPLLSGILLRFPFPILKLFRIHAEGIPSEDSSISEL